MLSALVTRTRGLCKIESCYHCVFIIVIKVFYDVYVDANINCKKDSTFRYITFLILEPITKTQQNLFRNKEKLEATIYENKPLSIYFIKRITENDFKMCRLEISKISVKD